MDQNKRICIGFIMGPQGVQGQVRVRSSTQNPADLFSYGILTDEKGERPYDLKLCGQSKGDFVASLKGVTSRNEAEDLKGTKLFVERDVLPPPPEDEYYLADLVSLDVHDDKGASIGTVQATHDYGAGIFLEIKPHEGKSFMLPFKDAFIPTVDTNSGFIQVLLPEDWLKEEKQP